MFGKGMVVALTGQRRVGKSCIVRCIYEKYAKDSHNNVIYIDMEKTTLICRLFYRTTIIPYFIVLSLCVVVYIF